MLFIDDERCEVHEGEKKCGSCANDNLRLAGGCGAPDAGAFAGADARMPFGWPRSRTAPPKRSRNCAVSAISGIRTKAWRPALQARGDRLEIDFRLADPVTPSSRVTREIAGGRRCRKRCGGLGLFAFQEWLSEIRIAGSAIGSGGSATASSAPSSTSRRSRRSSRLRLGPAPTSEGEAPFGRRKNSFPRRRYAARRRAREADADPHRLGASGGRRRTAMRKNHAAGGGSWSSAPPSR